MLWRSDRECPIIKFYKGILGFEVIVEFKNHNNYDGVFLGIEGLDWLSKFRHYVNLGHVEGKFTQLLRDFQWTTVRRAFSDVI